MSGHRFGTPTSIAIALGSLCWAGAASAQARFEIRGYVPVRCSSAELAPAHGSDVSLAADSCNSLDRVTVSMERRAMMADGSLVSLADDKSGRAIVQVVTISL